MREKRFRPVVVLAAVLALGASVTGPARAATEPTIPAACQISVGAVTTTGMTVDYTYAQGASSAKTWQFPTIGALPKAGIGPLREGNSDYLQRQTIVVAPDGWLTTIVQRGDRTANGSWSYSTKKTKVNSTWGAIRGLAHGSMAHLYALTPTGLNRYTMQNREAATIRSAGVVGTSGWGSVENLTYSRTIAIGTDPKGGTKLADVLLATLTSGALVEYTIPYDDPAQWSRATLKASGWGNFASLSQEACRAVPGSRVLLGIKANGDAYAYFDRYGDGRTLTGGTVKVATGWTARSYSD